MLHGIILPASTINLCVHRNHRWNRRGIIGTIRLAGCFNTFGALAIAAESYGLKGAVSLRVIQNVFGVVFALVFCAVFYRIMSVKAPVKEETV